MRIIATGDLHYGQYPRFDPQTEVMAADICRGGGDALVLVGDLGSGRTADFERALALFDGFPGRKLLVPGNHDLWTLDGDSAELYERVLPDIAAARGFSYLDEGPVRINGVGFAGSVGWYDYTLRDPSLPADDRWYAAKEYPGVVRWNDRRFVRWRYSDAEFTERCLARLAAHLREAGEGSSRVVCVTHHLPFENMVERKKLVSLAFCNAFMGSKKTGDLIMRHEKVTHLLCGHSHSQGEYRNGSVLCLKVGASYRKKTFATLDI
jgi:predicted phosphohydrolase